MGIKYLINRDKTCGKLQQLFYNKKRLNLFQNEGGIRK